jgi:hypothetical protein
MERSTVAEQEYIDATNLAKILCAKRCIHDLHTPDDDGKDETDRRAALQALRRWENRLWKKILTDE